MFNLEAMILSLVLDENFTHPDNIAEGYDLYTGKVIGPDNHYVKFTLEMLGSLQGILLSCYFGG